MGYSGFQLGPLLVPTSEMEKKDGEGGKINPLLHTWSQSFLLGVQVIAHTNQQHATEVCL